jgi:hypothetical protein
MVEKYQSHLQAKSLAKNRSTPWGICGANLGNRADEPGRLACFSFTPDIF